MNFHKNVDSVTPRRGRARLNTAGIFCGSASPYSRPGRVREGAVCTAGPDQRPAWNY